MDFYVCICVLSGFNLSRHVLQAIVRRYCGKECKLSFSDFVLVITKVATLVGEMSSLIAPVQLDY